MPVSAIQLPVVLPPPPRRSGVVERVARDEGRPQEERSVARSQALQQSGEAERLADLLPQQRAEATSRTPEVFSRRQSENENLSFSAQKALKAFAANTPSLEQRLGIELAGIDVFV